MGLEDWRDVIIIAAGSLTILVLLALFILTVVLGLTVRGLLGVIQTLLKDDVTPLVKSAQVTVHRVQGTTAFVGEAAVSPIIRVYGVVAGTRRAFGVLSGIASRRRAAAANNPDKPKE